MGAFYGIVVTWIKAELSNERDEQLNRFKETNDMTKPDAVNFLVRYALDDIYREEQTDD